MRVVFVVFEVVMVPVAGLAVSQFPVVLAGGRTRAWNIVYARGSGGAVDGGVRPDPIHLGIKDIGWTSP